MSANYDVNMIVDFVWNAGLCLGLLIGLCIGLIASPLLAKIWRKSNQ